MACRSSVRYRRGVGQRRGGLAGEDLQEPELVVAEDAPLRAADLEQALRGLSRHERDDQARPADSSASAGASPSTARRRRSSSSTPPASSPCCRGRRTRSRRDEGLAAPEQQRHGAPGTANRAATSPAHLRRARRRRRATRPARGSSRAAPAAACSGARRAGTAAHAGWRSRPARRGPARARLRRSEEPLARGLDEHEDAQGFPSYMSGTLRHACSPHFSMDSRTSCGSDGSERVSWTTSPRRRISRSVG